MKFRGRQLIRYIDGVLSPNNPDYDKYLSINYPSELAIVDTPGNLCLIFGLAPGILQFGQAKDPAM